MRLTSYVDKIASYYPAIDRTDYAEVLALFAPDAVYRRADVEYRSLEQIRTFFCEKRQIRGTHSIEAIWADRSGSTVFVTGSFEGRGAAGDPRSVGFADIWCFNARGLVSERSTYLALGHSYVEK